MNTKIIKLDLNRILYDKIIAKQGDTKSRFLLFQLLDGSIAFNLTNRSVRAYMVKPDGKEIFNDLIINNYSLGYCTLELTNQVLAVPGTVKIELMVTEEDRKLTSSVFELEVIKSINSEKSIVSTNEFTALLNGLSSLSEYDNYKNEIAAARDGEVNLLTKVKKIDEQLDKIKQQVLYLSDYVKDYENIADLTNLINEINSNNNPLKVIFNIPNLIIDKVYFITRGDIEIDYGFCNIEFRHNNYVTNNYATLAYNVNLGIFNFKGIIGNLEQTRIKEFKPYINNNTTDVINKGKFNGLITFTAPTNFDINDYLVIDVQTGLQALGQEKPYVRRLVKIIYILDNQNVIVDYCPKYTFTNLQTEGSFGGFYKANPLKNVKIKNYKIYDNNSFEYGHDVTPPDYVLNETVNGLFLSYIDGLEITNVSSKNISCNTIKTDFCRNVYVNNVFTDKPSIISAGHGYNLKFGATDEITVIKAKGRKTRHIVDFSCSSNATVSDSNGGESEGTSFLCHGMYEHDIVFNNCIGAFSLIANLSLGIGANTITFNNCKMNSFYNGLSKNVTINDSDTKIQWATISGSLPNVYNYLKINNSKVFIKEGNYYGYENGDFKKLEIINSDIIINDYTTFNVFDELLFINCHIKSDNKAIQLRDLKKVKISGVLENTNIVLDGNKKYVIMEDLLIRNESDNDLISFGDYSSNERILILDKIKYEYSNTIAKRFIVTKGTPSTTVNEKIIMNKCYLTSSNKMTGIVFFGDVDSNKVMLVNDNIFKGVLEESGKFDKTILTNNIWL